VRYQNVRNASFSFVTMYACDRQTDKLTDGQNNDPRGRSRICSCG